jgi:hypothetical protein
VNRLATPALGLALFLVNVWLGWPLFQAGELPFRGSIEGSYAGMARFVSAHPNPWGWNPLPYCGLPTQFMYVPALPYLAAAVIRLLPQVQPEMVYRTIVAVATCLGPVTMFLFALRFTGSRRWSLGAALAYSLFSPSYGLFPAVEKDRGIVQLPWRLQVLAKYGEGPHCTGLTLLPLALAALWRAGTIRAYGTLAAAALLLAAIPLTNWLSALALGMCSLLLLAAAWGASEFRASRAFAAAGLAYLLACFWLTPSFVRTIAFNWPADSFGYQLGDRQKLLLAGAAAGVILLRILFRALHGSFYFCLVTLGTFLFGWITTAYYVYGTDVIPESRRYALEFELFLMLALVEALRLAMRSANSTVRLCAMASGGLLLLAGIPQLWAYLKQGQRSWAPVPRESTIEYQLGRWIAERRPAGRAFATGGLRFRLNSWFDVPQVGGGFESGLQNRVPIDLAYRIRTGEKLRPGDTDVYLKALGAEYVVLHGRRSREYYRDFLHPERLTGTPALQIEDDRVYTLGPRPPAHVLREEDLVREDPREHPDALDRYVASMPSGALESRWTDASTIVLNGAPPGSTISVQVNADAGWRAQGADIGADRMGFIVLRNASGGAIELRYRGTAEQRIMAAISALAWIGIAGAALRGKLRRSSPAPA